MNTDWYDTDQVTSDTNNWTQRQSVGEEGSRREQRRRRRTTTTDARHRQDWHRQRSTRGRARSTARVASVSVVDRRSLESPRRTM